MFNPLEVLMTIFAAKSAARAVARRWRAAAAQRPELRTDLMEIGGVLALQPMRRVDGIPELDAVDPQRLAYEAGRRDLALQLLALMSLSNTDFNSLMEKNDED